MTLSLKTRQIADLLKQKPELKHADIAKQVGCDRRRVYQVGKYLERNGQYQEFDALKLIQARVALDWSLRELARQSGVNASQISRWERRRAEPCMPQWIKVATALGVKPEDLRKGGL